MPSKHDVKVYIGRCNPFHLGHAHVLRDAIETSKLVIILLGSAGLARSLKNPFVYKERKAMIQSWISSEIAAGRLDPKTMASIEIAALRDYPYNNALWIRSVQRKVHSIVTEHAITTGGIYPDIHITGSDRDESTWYLKAFPQWKQALVDEHRYGERELSATQIREILFDPSSYLGLLLVNMIPKSTYDFLVEFAKTPEHTRLVSWYQQNKAYKEAWSVAPYAPIFTTVDAVIVQSGHVLVVERGAEPGKGLWALPGGFLNQNERLRDGVVREVMEETGVRLADGKRTKELTEEILKKSIREHEVFDAPDRSMRGRTITHAFFIRLDDTKPLPKVKGQNVPHAEATHFRLGHTPAFTSEKNRESWMQIAALFSNSEYVGFDALITAVENHDAPGGGKSFVEYCIRLSWLLPEVETAKAFWLPIDQALTRTEMWFEDHHSIVEWGVSRYDQ